MVMVQRDLFGGGEWTIPYAEDVLYSYTLETCMVLLTNVTLINSIKNKSGLELKNKTKYNRGPVYIFLSVFVK